MADNQKLQFTITADDKTKAAWDQAVGTAKRFTMKIADDASKASMSMGARLRSAITSPFRALGSLRLFAFTQNLSMIKNGVEEIGRAMGELIERGNRAAIVGQSFAFMTGTAGASARKLASELQAASMGTLSLVRAQEIANRGLSSGMSIDDLKLAMEFISKKALTTGADLNNAVGTVITGLVRGSTLFLDDFGVLVDGTDGVKRAFDAINGSGAFDKMGPAAQKAEIVRAALEDMRRQMDKIGVSGNESAFTFARMKATIDDIKNDFAQAFAATPEVQGATAAMAQLADRTRAFFLLATEDIRKLGLVAFRAISDAATSAFSDMTGALKQGGMAAVMAGITKAAFMLASGIIRARQGWELLSIGIQATRSTIAGFVGLAIEGFANILDNIAKLMEGFEWIDRKLGLDSAADWGKAWIDSTKELAQSSRNLAMGFQQTGEEAQESYRKSWEKVKQLGDAVDDANRRQKEAENLLDNLPDLWKKAKEAADEAGKKAGIAAMNTAATAENARKLVVNAAPVVSVFERFNQAARESTRIVGAWAGRVKNAWDEAAKALDKALGRRREVDQQIAEARAESSRRDFEAARSQARSPVQRVKLEMERIAFLQGQAQRAGVQTDEGRGFLREAMDLAQGIRSDEKFGRIRRFGGEATRRLRELEGLEQQGLGVVREDANRQAQQAMADQLNNAAVPAIKVAAREINKLANAAAGAAAGLLRKGLTVQPPGQFDNPLQSELLRARYQTTLDAIFAGM